MRLHKLMFMTISMTAYIVTELLKSKPVYDLLLARMLKNKDDNKFVGDDSKKALLEVAVAVSS